MIRWSRALASLLVVFGVLTPTWAICAEGATATATEQMACCKAGHAHCPMKDSAPDCCQTSGPHEWQGTLVGTASLSAPVPASAPLAWAILPAGSSACIQRLVSYDSPPPRLLFAPPAYIAFSALLI